MPSLYKACLLPADGKHIRVLHILPISASSPEGDNERIKGILRCINLDEQPKPTFTALSYVWGAYAPDPHYILCNNLRVKVTSNCYTALRHLRRKFNGLTIWIDAVCINQRNRKEKEQQIPLMGDIYSRADLVFIWLGEGTARTDRAMTYLDTPFPQNYYRVESKGKTISRPSAASWYIWVARWSRTRHPIPFDDDEKIVTRPGGFEKLLQKLGIKWQKNRHQMTFKGHYTTTMDLKELLSKDWITRIWTYQEILLASKPVVVCGEKYVAWHNFERNLLFLANTPYFRPQSIVRPWTHAAMAREMVQSLGTSPTSANGDLDKFVTFITMISNAHEFLLRWIQNGYFLFMASILGVIVSITVHVSQGGARRYIPVVLFSGMVFLFLLTLPIIRTRSLKYKFRIRNKMFADSDILTALYSRTATQEKDMAYGMWAVLGRAGTHDLPKPDYTADTGEIFRMFSIRMIEMTGSLQLLLLAAIRGYPGQPSWVPDWSSNKSHEWDNIDTIPKSDQLGRKLTLIERGEFVRVGVQRFKGRFQFNKARTAITVSALHVGNIEFCNRFYSTHEGYLDSERPVHLENLRLMLECVSLESVNVGILLLQVYEIGFPQNLINALQIDVTQDMKDWAQFCRANCGDKKRLTRILDRLRQQPSIFLAHVSICNLLATASRMSFIASSSNEPGRPFLGSGSWRVHDGDQIVRVRGLPQLLILRPNPHAEGSWTIVSPAAMFSLHKVTRPYYPCKPHEWYVSYEIR